MLWRNKGLYLVPQFTFPLFVSLVNLLQEKPVRIELQIHAMMEQLDQENAMLKGFLLPLHNHKQY